MSNEQYLIASYFVTGALALAIAVMTYLCLRRSFGGIAEAVPNGTVGGILKRLFLPGITFASLAGFLSVSFRSCEKDTYAKIVADRAYLVAKNHEQVSSSLWHVIAALFVWCVILLVPLAMMRKRERGNDS